MNREATKSNTGRISVGWLLTGLMLALGVYHLVTAYFGQPQAQFHRALHLTAMLGFSYSLAIHRQWQRPPSARTTRDRLFQWVRWAALCAVVWSGAYILVDVNAFAQRVAAPNAMDVLAGTILIVALLDAGRRHLGWAIVIVSSAFLIYPLVASEIPGPLRGASSDWSQVIDTLVVQNHGLFGISVGAMANFIIHFMIFAALLQVCGAENFFIRLARATVGKRPGGVGKVSVVSSAMLGTISGSAMANVASTGSFTIPMMRRAGFRPEFAGALEAVASSGGQLVPPIMGVAAFLMADILGVPYVDIVTAASVPALLYFLALYVMVHLEGKRIHATADIASLSDFSQSEESGLSVLARGWPFLLPIGAIVVFLFQGFSVTRSALWGVLLMAVLGFSQAKFRRRPLLLLEGIAVGVRQAIPVAIATGVVGIIIGGVSLGDLGRRLGLIVRDIAGTELFFALLLLALVSVILGMAMPTVAVYITLAVTVVPAIVEMGVAPIPAHLFAFYFGIIANITPPVAVAAFVAAGISGSDPMRTGVMAFRLGLVAYIVPFAFVYHPILVSPEVSFTFFLALLTAVGAAVILGMSVIGWAGATLPHPVRWLGGFAAVGLLIPGTVSDLIGIGLTVAFGAAVVAAMRRERMSQSVEEGIDERIKQVDTASQREAEE